MSVVIPTFQRRQSLERVLDSLAQQTLAPDRYEVIVSVDGSTDGTREMLARYAAPYALQTVHHASNKGRAAACNRGIRHARGDMVVILDDDMEPSASLLEQHQQVLLSRPGCAVVGAVPIAFDERSSTVVRYVGDKFNRHLEKLARPDSRIGCRDFYSGNFAARRATLVEAGLFDESFSVYGNEDVELGLRLVAHGVPLVYAPNAIARQHYEKTLTALVKDHVAKGRSAVLLATKHPDCVPYLKLSTYRSGSIKWRTARRVLIACTRLVPWTREAVVACLMWMERHNEAALERYLPMALDYFFWLGAVSALREQRMSVRELASRQLHPQSS